MHVYVIKSPNKTQLQLLEAIRDEFGENFNAQSFTAHVSIVPSNIVKQSIRNDYLG